MQSSAAHAAIGRRGGAAQEGEGVRGESGQGSGDGIRRLRAVFTLRLEPGHCLERQPRPTADRVRGHVTAVVVQR